MFVGIDGLNDVDIGVMNDKNVAAVRVESVMRARTFTSLISASLSLHLLITVMCPAALSLLQSDSRAGSPWHCRGLSAHFINWQG